MKTKSRFQSDSKTPLYLQLTEDVRTQIKSGVLQPGDRLPSIAELRASHGLCKHTIERAHQILEQEKIVIRKVGRGTFVTKPVDKPKFVVAVGSELLSDQQNPYWFNLLQGICEGARRHRVEVIFSSHDPGSVWERASGMIVTGKPEAIYGEAPAAFSLVSLLWPAPGADCVVADDYAGVYQLTEHLIDLGHRRIAVLYKSQKTQSPITDARLHGYRGALEANGIAYDANLMRTQALKISEKDNYFSYLEAGREGVQRWLKKDWKSLKCSALIAYNDGMALGAIQALREAGLRVPQDVSVVGFDGTSAFEHVHPSLTTIHVPLRKIGRAGLELLMRRLEGDASAPPRTEIPLSLVKGESSGVAPS